MFKKGICLPNARYAGSIPNLGTKIPQPARVSPAHCKEDKAAKIKRKFFKKKKKNRKVLSTTIGIRID